jgi:hypothetical protein
MVEEPMIAVHCGDCESGGQQRSPKQTVDVYERLGVIVEDSTLTVYCIRHDTMLIRTKVVEPVRVGKLAPPPTGSGRRAYHRRTA